MVRDLRTAPLLLLLICVTYVVTSDVTCGATKTTETVTIKQGESSTFRTQAGDQYGGKVKCKVTYKKDKSCPEMRFFCSSFALTSKKANCKGGDVMTIKTKKIKNKKFCQSSSPDMTTTKGFIKVTFKSSKKHHGDGAVCRAECISQVTTEEPTTVEPTTGSVSYSQQWVRGDGPAAHPHEGIRLEDRSGWVAIGENLNEDNAPGFLQQVQIRKADNSGATVWTTNIGADCSAAGLIQCNTGFSIIQKGSMLYAGVGLLQGSKERPVVLALNAADGSEAWRLVLDSGTGHGGVRSVVLDGDDLLCTGYTDAQESGFQFVVDEGKAKVWKISLASNPGVLSAETTLSVESLTQGAKIRVDPSGGYVVCSTVWGVLGGKDVNLVALVKIASNLQVEWSKSYGDGRGDSQVFDMLIDNDGNYLLGGHTTAGDGVINWDYLAVKVNSQTQGVEWRLTFGQPRGFDANFIHDEMYGVALDLNGNYLLLGGSGDEYSYSATNPDGWSSDIWVSYLVVLDPQGGVLHQGVYGNKNGNNAGEWLSVDKMSGEVMIYTDSDTVPGFGFLSLTPN